MVYIISVAFSRLKNKIVIDRTGQISISLYQLAQWSPTLDKAICTTVHQTKKNVYMALVTNIPDIHNFGTNCAPLVADLFWFCYERDFMLSLSDKNQTDIIEGWRRKTGLSPPVKYFTDRSKAVLLLWIFYVFVLSCVCFVLCASVYMCFVVTCWERADLLALVCGVFCEFVTFPLVSWVRCGTWLYRFLIFAPLLTFNSTSRYLDDLLNIDNPNFEQMVGQIYPTEPQLNKTNSSDTEAPFSDLNLSITNGIVSSKIDDKRDDFNFEIVNSPFLDGDVPRSPSYGVYISQLIRFARVCSNVDDFNNRNLFLTA